MSVQPEESNRSDQEQIRYGFLHCGGTKPDGTTFEDWIRATFGLRKVAGEWRITHQHNSAPIKR